MESLLQDLVISFSFFALTCAAWMNKLLFTENNFLPHFIIFSLEYAQYKNLPKECRQSINCAIIHAFDCNQSCTVNGLTAINALTSINALTFH